MPATPVERERLKESSGELADIPMPLSGQHQRQSVTAFHHRLETRLDLRQPMPTDLPIYHLDCIFVGVIGGLQGQNRIKEVARPKISAGIIVEIPTEPFSVRFRTALVPTPLMGTVVH